MYHIHDRVQTIQDGRRLVWQVEDMLLGSRWILLRRLTSDGLLLDYRSHKIVGRPLSEVQHFCTACHGAHHVQRCPEIRAHIIPPAYLPMFQYRWEITGRTNTGKPRTHHHVQIAPDIVQARAKALQRIIVRRGLSEEAIALLQSAVQNDEPVEVQDITLVYRAPAK